MGGSYKQGQGLIIRQIKQHHVSEGLINLYYILYNYRNMGGSYKQGQGLIIRQIKHNHVSEGLINLYYILYNNYRNTSSLFI
jgi:hypothetical protein